MAGGVRRRVPVFLAGLWLWLGAHAVAALPGPGEENPAAARSVAKPAPGGTVAFYDWLGRPAVEREKAEWQRRKNPTLAMVSSFLVPGLGQLYNERELWTLVAAGVHFYFLGNIIVEARLTNHYRNLKNLPFDPMDPEQVEEHEQATVLFLLHRDNRIQSSWLLALTLLLSGVQSFVDAHLFDFEADAPLRLEPALGDVRGGVLRLRF